MKRKFILSIILVSTLNFMSCASSTFIVKSDPLEADVFVQDLKTEEKKILGKTPLEMSMSLVKETVGETVMAGEFFTVSVEKKGFITQKMNIPASRFGTLITSLDLSLKAGDEPKQIKIASEVLDHLFIAQKLALSKEYERSQIEIDKILELSPDFARAMTMRGSIYFVQKKYPESLKWYEEALKSDAKMEEAMRMIARIKNIQNGGVDSKGDTKRDPAQTQVPAVPGAAAAASPSANPSGGARP